MMNTMNFMELASLYTGSNAPSELKEWFDNKDRDVVIAYLYVNNTILFHQTASSYIGLDEHTIDDIIITQIWRCLQDFNEEKSNGKITTYICKYIRNACRTKTQSENMNKRKVNQRNNSTLFSQLECQEDDGNNSILNLVGGSEDREYVSIEIQHYLDQLDLSENQRKFCEIVLAGEDDIIMADISREMGVSNPGVLKIKKQLQKKLVDLIA